MSKKITLTVDIQAQLNNFQSDLAKMQQMFDKLKMPNQAGFNASLKELQDRYKHIIEMTEGNKIDLVDEKKVEAEFNAIQKGYNNLISKIQRSSDKISLIDTKKTDILKSTFNELKDSIKAVTKDNVIDSNLQQALKTIEALEIETNKLQKAFTNASAALEPQKNHYDDLKKKQEELSKSLADNKEKLDQAEFNKKGQRMENPMLSANYRKVLAEVSPEIERITKELGATNDELDELEKSEAFQKLNTDYEKAAKNLETNKGKFTALEEAKKAAETYKNVLTDKEVSNAIDKLKATGIDFGIDLDSIKSVEDFKNVIKSFEGIDVSDKNKVIQELVGNMENLKEKTNGVGEATNRAAEDAKEFDKTLEGFKDKAKYFFGIENAINLLKRAVRSAFNTVKELDEVMTETAVVTNFDVGDMWDQLPQYTQRANELGVSIHDAYKAATLYYQQGLKTNEVMAVSNETLKMARIANLDAADATSRMTNALRGFNMEINETSAQRVNDVYSELAAITASDTKEISTAMTKVASLAHNANMEFETTSAFLAQMIETTRESAETAGTALKTVIARFSEVKKLYSQGDLMGTDEEGQEIDVNKVSQALRSAGINMNEYLTGAKGLDDIFLELASKWDNLDMIQQRYIATMAAGSRQQSRFIAMMSDYKRTTELVAAANNSAGASQRQFNKTLESFQSKLAKLKNSWDTFLMGIADNEIIKGAIDLLTSLLDSINKLTEGLDGIPGSLTRIGIAFGGLKIGKEISTHFLGSLLKMRDDASKIADGTGKTFVQRLTGWFNKVPNAFENTKNAANELGKSLNQNLHSNIESLDEMQKTNLARMIGNKTIDKQVLLTGELTTAQQASIAATKGQILAQKMHTATVAGAFLKLGVLIGGIVSLVYILKKANDMWGIFKTDVQKASERLEKLEDSANNASQAAQDATESYNTLRDSLESLDEKYEGIEKMTRGTQEWRDAILEVNNEVLSLSEKYKDLELKSENGVLKITNAEDVKASQYGYSVNAQAANLAAQMQVAQQRAATKKAEYSALASHISTVDQERAINRISINDLSTNHDFEDIESLSEEAVELLKEQNKLEAEALKISEQRMSSTAALALSSADLSEGTESQTSNFLNSRRMESYYIAAFNDIAEEGMKISDVKEEIAKESGFLTYSEYVKEFGEIADDAAQGMLANIRATKKATNAASEFSGKLGLLSKEANKIYSRSDLAGLSKSDIESLLGEENFKQYQNASEQERKNIVKEVAQVDGENLWNESPALREAYNNNIKAFLFDIGSDYVEGVENSLAGIEQATNKVRNLGYSVQRELLPKMEGLSGGVANDLADKMTELYKTGGSQGIIAITKDIENLGIAEEKQETFIKALNSIDWEDVDSVNSLDELIEDLGIVGVDVSALTKDIIEFSQAVNKVNFEKAVEQLNKMYSLLASLQSGKLTETGWSAEQMQLTIDAGADLTDFIYDPLTDTYTLVDKDLSRIIELLDKDSTNRKDILENSVAKGTAAQKLRNELNPSDRQGYLSFFESLAEQGKVSDEYVSKLYSLPEEALKGEYNDFIKKYVESLDANTSELQKINDSELMKKTPEELAEMGTEDSRRALEGQARRYGVGEDLINRYQYNQENMVAINNIFKEAQSLDYNTDELNDYIKNLKLAHKQLTRVEAAQAALSSTKFTNGFKKIVDSYDDWTKLIKEDGTLLTDLDKESSIIVENFKNAAEEMLDTDLGDDFWYGDDAAKNIELIKQAAEGSTKALRELEVQAGKISGIKIKPDIDESVLEQEVAKMQNYLTENIPDLEVGASLNTEGFNETLQAMSKTLGIAVEDMSEIFEGLGFSLEPVPTKKIKYVPNIIEGVGQVGYKPIEVAGEAQGIEWKVTRKRPGTMPHSITPVKSSGSGGGSGSDKEEKPDFWENPFDELYNLQEKINESIRTREALERKYQKTVKLTESRLGEVTKAYADQIKQLRAEADLEKQMQEGRARQLNNIGNEIYTDSEGNRATFASLGVMKYASYDQNTGVITIDWPALEEIAKDPNRTKEGEAAEAYIKRLEELQTQFEEVRDKLWDIEDKIEELREEAIDNYLTFEDRVMEALVNSYQQEIDDFKELSDTIKSTADDVIKNIQEDVALARQIRDNTKKEEDIAEMEARLAYLRRDTSGANDLEIKQLEEELNQARQDYSDDLIDQQIQQMQDEAEKAAEQREHQIELMQHSLDMAIKNGDLWEEVYGLIDSSVNDEGVIIDNSPLMELLKSQEAFGSLSKIGQAKWWEEVTEAVKKALVGLGVAEDKYNIGDNDRRTGVSLDTFVERLYKEVLGRDADEAGKKYWVEQLQSGKLSRADVLKSFLGSEEFSKKNMGDEDFVETLYKTFFGRASDAEGKSYWTGQLKSGAKTRDDLINEFLKSTEWINSFMPKPGAGTKKPIGGGTSWADDTEKLPTMLDRKDSENLVVLKDILGNLLNVSGGDAVKSNGDTYFDIHIDAEIGSDYDVDQLVERIKKQIYDTSAYRNANVINYIR